jgi:glycosyltransferase involved in cell wall biosynthesis
MLSIIVPAYNEEQLLGRTLRAAIAAAKASGEPWEIIVADDASTDRTAAIALEHGARLVRVHHRQIAATRNAGARAAKGDLLIFVDADTVVTAAAVRAAARAMYAGAVGGGCTVYFDGVLPMWARLLLSAFMAAYRACHLAAGCFLFCTREAFEAVGGFDEKLFGSEELTMSNALKRCGRFVVLRDHVITSARKIRAYSVRELLSPLTAVLRAGPKALQRREALAIWYGERRDDPERRGAPQRRTETSATPLPRTEA